MNKRIFEAFDEIHADEKLKENTLAYVKAQRGIVEDGVKKATEDGGVERPKVKGSPVTASKALKSTRAKTGALKRGLALAAAAVLLLFVGIFSYNSYSTPRVYLDIDVNPSIELTLNEYDRVIGTYAYNEEGEDILAKVALENKTSEEAIMLLIDVMIEEGYLEEASLFTATMQDRNNVPDTERLSALQAYVNSLLAERGLSVEQEVFTVDEETKLHSHHENMTPAKYLAVLELQKVDPNASFDSCRSHSIGEIRQQTHDHALLDHNANTDTLEPGYWEGDNGFGESNEEDISSIEENHNNKKSKSDHEHS